MNDPSVTPKVRRSGNSLTLQLPRASKVTTKSHQVTPTTAGFVMADPAGAKRRRKALDRLLALPPLDYDLPRP